MESGAVTLSAATLSQYRRFSLYNSPYPAHHHGRAIDLYPDDGAAPSPVAGRVVETMTVRAPPKPYAVADDHLVVLDTGTHLVRVLHVDPGVARGDRVAVGDSLGETVRSGFFAPWVDDHLHVGFRARDADPYRATGSLPVAVDVPLRALDWDGTGVVREVGETYVVLDAPRSPVGAGAGSDPPATWTGLAGAPGVVLDGGCPHYDGGGVLSAHEGPVSVAGSRVGVARGRDVRWDDVALVADGRRLTGLSLFVARGDGFGAKLVCPAHGFAVGDRLTVTVE